MTPSPGFTRWQASGIRLSITAAIAAIALSLMLKVWYPPPLFTAEGGNDILLIMIAVDIVLGPLITLIIFKPGKPGLRLDLVVIAVLQAGALLYGCHVMLQARPVYIVLVGDQFETVRANDLAQANIAQASRAFQSLPVTGPVFVAVVLPKDMKALKELIAQAQDGGDLVQHLPRYYVPYSDYKAEALSKSRPLDVLQKDDKNIANRIDQLIVGTGRKASDLNFLPLQMRQGWGAVLFDGKTGDIVAMLPPFIL